MSFAAAEQGNSKAAKRAREAAYTEQESPETFDNLLLNASDKQPAIQPVKYSSVYNDYLEKKEPSQDNSKSWNIIGNAFDLPEADENSKNNSVFEVGNRPSFVEGFTKSESKIEPSVTLDNNGSEVVVMTDKLPQSSLHEEVTGYLKKYFDDDYNVGKTTTDILINEMQLESLHKYLSDGIKNAERPNNIGKGLWAKQVEDNLKWVDDAFGKSSKLAKALKTMPAITIGIDTALGISENAKNRSEKQETISDAVIDIGLGMGEAVWSGFVGAFVGGISGAIAGILAGLAYTCCTDYIKYDRYDGKTFKQHLDSLF